MILNDNEIETRLESPLNLINKLNSLRPKKSLDIFIPPSEDKRFKEPDEFPAVVIDEDKIKMGLIKTQATDILHESLTELRGRLGEVSKVKDLSLIAKDMKTILSEDGDSRYKNQNNIVIYKPVVNDISKYETLVVME